MSAEQEPLGEPVALPGPGTPWAVLQLVHWSAEFLKKKGVERGRLDAEYLLADVLGMGRLELYLHFDRPLTPDELGRYRPLLRARARREPLQYILGRAAFRDLELVVDRRVLIPRPETEELVGAVLAHVRASCRTGLSALDVGTGSGAIALALASEGPFARVVATDLSAEALVVAEENARRTGLRDRVEFRQGRLLEPLRPDERFDVVISNPPYIGRDEFEGLAPEVRDWEPRAALAAGEGGLGVIRALVTEVGAAVQPGGLVALEVGATQARAVAGHIREAGGFAEPEILRDVSRHERIVLAVRESRAADPARQGESRSGAAGATRA